MADIQLLATELSTDPLTRGYAGMGDEAAADDLNTVYRTRNLSSISGDSAFGATNETEFAALIDSKKQLWLAWCGRETIDPFQAANVAFVQWVFGGGSATVAALSGLRTEQVSRANELGIGHVQPGNVTEARA